MDARPNIVWITLDSIRADHTTLDGYHRDTTPELDRIAGLKNGNFYQECITHGNWSLSSIASILTGKYPGTHKTGIGGNALPNTIPTIPEQLSEAGYQTAALSRNPNLSRETDLDRGFDRFAYLSPKNLLTQLPLRTLLKYGVNIRRHSAGLSTDQMAHSTPFLMNDLAKRWLTDFTQTDDPFFCYFHYNEPHYPYYPPLPYLDKFTDNIAMSAREAGEFVLDVFENYHQHIADGCKFSADEWDALNAMYDAEIFYQDKCLGRLFDYIQGKVDRETIILVTADHGDLFGEKNLLGHTFALHDGLIRVPMVTHSLDADGELVQHTDFMKTLLNIIGLDSSGVAGVDLRESNREFAVSQTGDFEFDRYQDGDGFNPSNLHQPAHTAIRTSEWKVLTSSEKTELFELPDETTEVAKDHPQKVHTLTERYVEWAKTNINPHDETQTEYSDEMKQQLKDLGYA